MNLTPQQLTARQDAILDALEHTPGDRTFRGKLYRDGVPSPASYLAQPVRVLFVFREPNLSGTPRALDMRDEIRDVRFRPLRDGRRQDASGWAWWNNKVGLFAHAVASALAGQPESEEFERFRAVVANDEWHHELVNRFAYIQIKKLGGGGTSKPKEICAHAERSATTLKRQVDLYRPHLVIGCGLGKHSPARLLAAHVLPGGRKEVTSNAGATWWRFPAAARPVAMVQLYHPSSRHLERSFLYRDIWSSVREVAGEVGVGRRK